MMQRLFIDPSVGNSWRSHQREWKHCQKCPVAKIRTNVCLFRGDLPCEALFLGEAPGESEDLLGFPFVGPAGALFDKLLADAITSADYIPTYGISNIMGCFPNNEREIRKPTDQEAAACRPRLDEIIKIASPKLIVTLGQIAKKHLPIVSVPVVNLTHPAAFLRDKRDTTLEKKKFVLVLTRHFQNLKSLSSYACCTQ
jgi:uracil-DNA glycosylase family 4